MTQESQTETLTLTGTLYDTWNICHHKRLAIAIRYDTKVRLECSERIVRNLRLCRRHRREQCRLSGIREANKTYIGKQLQLKSHSHLLHRFARLRKTWSLTCRRCKVHIAKTTASALEQSHQLAVLHYIAEKLTGLGIIGHCTARHINDLALAIGTCTLVDATVLTIAGKDVTLVLKVKQSPVVPVSTQDYITTFSAISAVRTTVWYIFCTMQVRHTTATTTRTAHNLYIIYEI